MPSESLGGKPNTFSASAEKKTDWTKLGKSRFNPLNKRKIWLDFFLKANKKNILSAAFLLLCFTESAMGFESQGFWTTNHKEIKADLKLEIVEKVVQVKPDRKTVITRVKNVLESESIEPMSIRIKSDLSNIKSITEEFARKSKRFLLLKYLKEAPDGQIISPKDKHHKRIIIGPSALKYLRKNSLRSALKQPSHELKIDLDHLRSDSSVRNKVWSSVSPLLGADRKRILKKTLLSKERFASASAFLPKFAAERLRTFASDRGLNCFHAAVSFSSPNFPKIPSVNPRREPGHHREMINHDELSRIFDYGYYEINPKTTKVKYGDVVAYFDIHPKNRKERPHYKTLKHASVFLFNDYVFAKGSKSANSAYRIRKLKDEWADWKKYTNHLAVKIYRKSSPISKRGLPQPRNDWLY